MTLLTQDQLAAIRRTGEQGMVATVVVHHRVPVDVDDDSNPFGTDDERRFSTEDTTVKGWLTGPLERSFSEDASQIVVVHDKTLRVPVGTIVVPRDSVTVNAQDYTVVDATTDHTWPEWTVCYLKRMT